MTSEPENFDEYLAAIAAALNVQSIGVTATDGDAPMPWAVYDPETDDILGAGCDLTAAAAEAWATVRGWEN